MLSGSSTMILHTLNKTSPELLAQLCAASSQDDVILLIEDGVYHALSADALTQLHAHAAQVCVLADDASARGIAASHLTLVDYTGFVELSARCSKTVNWY